jgi:hypothetical protein
MQASRCYKMHHAILPLIREHLDDHNRVKPGASRIIAKQTGLDYATIPKYVMDLRREGYLPPAITRAGKAIERKQPDPRKPTADEITARATTIRIEKGEYFSDLLVPESPPPFIDGLRAWERRYTSR